MGIRLRPSFIDNVKDINFIMVELTSIIDLRRWMKAEIRKRGEDDNFKFIKFDLLAELLTEDANMMFRYRRAFTSEKWRQTLPLMERDMTPEETKARLELIRNQMLEKGYKAKIVNTSRSEDRYYWHLMIEMKNVPVELSGASYGHLEARLPYLYNSSVRFSNVSLSRGLVPYTDEQLIDVLVLLDKVIPDVERDVIKGVTEYRAQKTARKIIDISDNVTVHGVMNETGLQYSATMTSRGMRIWIPIGDKCTLSFRIKKNNHELDAEHIRTAVESIRKAAEILGPGMMVEPKL